MKKYLFIIPAIFLLLQCKKSKFSDLSGSATLQGNVLLYDTLNGISTLVTGKSAKVFLKYTGNSSGFIYSTTANGSGQYSFTGIDPDSAYTIYAGSDTGTVKYYGELVYPRGTITNERSDTLKLYPSNNNQNILHLIVQDITGGRIYNVSAWTFNSPVLFAADASAGKVFDMTTNSYGVSNRYNIAPGNYYLRVKTKIGNIDLAGETSVLMETTGIKTVFITLQNNPLTRNGIEVHVTDIYTTPIDNAKVYAYRSQAIFMADTINYNAGLFTLTSNAAGLASTYIIDPATYYLRAVKIINKDTLVETGNVTVGSNTIGTLTMVLKKK